MFFPSTFIPVFFHCMASLHCKRRCVHLEVKDEHSATTRSRHLPHHFSRSTHPPRLAHSTPPFRPLPALLPPSLRSLVLRAALRHCSVFLLNPVTPNDLSLIRRLEFHFPRNAVLRGFHVPGDFTVCFDFTSGLQEDEAVDMDFDKEMRKSQRWKGRFRMIEAHLREAFGWVVREMISRHGDQRCALCKDDLDVLLAALR